MKTKDMTRSVARPCCPDSLPLALPEVDDAARCPDRRGARRASVGDMYRLWGLKPPESLQELHAPLGERREATPPGASPGNTEHTAAIALRDATCSK